MRWLPSSLPSFKSGASRAAGARPPRARTPAAHVGTRPRPRQHVSGTRTQVACWCAGRLSLSFPLRLATPDQAAATVPRAPPETHTQCARPTWKRGAQHTESSSQDTYRLSCAPLLAPRRRCPLARTRCPEPGAPARSRRRRGTALPLLLAAMHSRGSQHNRQREFSGVVPLVATHFHPPRSPHGRDRRPSLTALPAPLPPPLPRDDRLATSSTSAATTNNHQRTAPPLLWST